MKSTAPATGQALVLASVLAFVIGGSEEAVARGSTIRPQPTHSDTRLHDSRTFSVATEIRNQAGDITYTLAFDPLPGAQSFAGIYQGIQGPAGYRIELPDDWNGKLVMYAHGYRGVGDQLTISAPRIRRWLIENGYAWAASSYSANFYDVRAGVEDTNALAMAFTDILADHGEQVEAPEKIYITGHSMGGHITAAAIEAETHASARNKVRYDGAVPMCGVTADVYQFEYLMNYTFAAQHLAGLGPTSYPAQNYSENLPYIIGALWNRFPTSYSVASGEPSELGLKLEGIVRNLSGGERPIFYHGFRTAYQGIVMRTGGRDGTVNGILADNLSGNINVNYQFDSDSAMSAEEREFNDTILRVVGHPPANKPRADGLRWIPVVNGEFDIPVVSLHTLGDLYVPFRNMQIYQQRADEHGNGERLVQRAIRSPGHCDFTYTEEVEAVSDMLAWEQTGVKPAGDDVLTAAEVAAPVYGCEFTRDVIVTAADARLVNNVRSSLPACPSEE